MCGVIFSCILELVFLDVWPKFHVGSWKERRVIYKVFVIFNSVKTFEKKHVGLAQSKKYHIVLRIFFDHFRLTN